MKCITAVFFCNTIGQMMHDEKLYSEEPTENYHPTFSVLFFWGFFLKPQGCFTLIQSPHHCFQQQRRAALSKRSSKHVNLCSTKWKLKSYLLQ